MSMKALVYLGPGEKALDERPQPRTPSSRYRRRRFATLICTFSKALSRPVRHGAHLVMKASALCTKSADEPPPEATAPFNA
jgi:hypothetical protein